MTEMTSVALVESIGWSEDGRNTILEGTFQLHSTNIALIRSQPASEPRPSIFDDLRVENVALTGRSGSASMLELYEAFD